MIEFIYETEFKLPKSEAMYEHWLNLIIESEGKELGEISYTFCDDAFLHRINVEYLNHDTLTDIITFDYCEADLLFSDIYISVERIADNAKDFGVSFEEELLRVMAHGVLHLCGYTDKDEQHSKQMREKEEEKMKLFK